MNYALQHADKGADTMDTFKAMNIVEGFAESDEAIRLQAWSFLIRNNDDWMVHGSELPALIAAGKIDHEGNILTKY